MNPPGAAVTAKSTLERIADYFTTVKGWLSVVPTFITLFDAAKGWLPISSVLKPWVYILIVLLTFFAIWLEVSKTAGTVLSDIQKQQMRRAATGHVIAAVLLIGGYWVLGDVLDAFTPTQVAVRTLMLFVLAAMVGVVFAEISRAFAILALATD